ncbi:MAG TPA: AzlC family ABC transporter permease [Anaerolineales bacterium]|jgi:4-azaleucine resistance transporter AzlC|nr:AzlC family ABC transporter permease [Anaerolineales bacterium]
MQATHNTPALPPPRAEFLSGVKAELPLMIGVIPFGMIYGILAIAVGLPPSAAQAMSVIIFAGSSQFVSAQLFGLSVPAIINLFTIGVINLRHALYSASIAPYLQKLPNRWKLVLAYLLTDEAYAVTIIQYQQDGDNRNKHWFFLGSGLTLWTTWQLSTAAGIFLGATVPASWSLDFTLALIFIALVVPALKDRASLGAALTAGVAAVLLFNLPLKTGLLIASLIGIVVGLVIEGRS